ncbi:MAG: OmpA family protein, partial [Actinomycetota bacterium]
TATLRSLSQRTCLTVGGRVLALVAGPCTVQMLNSTGAVQKVLKTTIATDGVQVGLTLRKRNPVAYDKWAVTPKITPTSLVDPASRAQEVFLVGHTAMFTGNGEENSSLSITRAKELRKFLIGKKVDGSKIRAIGIAARQPIARKLTETTQYVNRRVEVYFVPGS